MMTIDNVNNDLSTEPIKIFFLIDELNSGGTERQLVLLCENLNRKYFSPTIGVLRGTNFSRGLALKTTIVNFNWHGFPLVKNVHLIMRLRKYITSNNFDIIQTHFQESELYGVLSSFFSPGPHTVITTRRNLYHWVSNDRIMFNITKLLSKKVDHIVSNSHAAKGKCLLLENVPSRKVTVIQNAIDVSGFGKIDNGLAKEKLHIDPSKKVVGVVGNWRPVKGIDCFIKAAKMLSDEDPDMFFVVAGQGPQKEYLEYLAIMLGVYEKMLFLENAHIPTVIASLDVAVQPSLSESLSNVLLEYMASAKAIVATDVGDASLLIQTGQDGILIKAGEPEKVYEAVLYMIKNKSLSETMGLNAYNRVVGNCSISSIVGKYEQLYMGLVKRFNCVG